MDLIMYKKILILLSLTTVLLTGCGAENQVIFNAPTDNPESCVLGKWTQSGSVSEAYLYQKIIFTEDHLFLSEKVVYTPLTKHILIQIAQNYIRAQNERPSEPINYNNYKALIHVMRWDIREGQLFLSGIINSSSSQETTKPEIAVSNAYDKLDLQNLPTEDLTYTSRNVHCDEQYMTEASSRIGTNIDMSLISESPLTYQGSMRVYENDDYLIEEYTRGLTLFSDGTAELYLDHIFTENPERNIFLRETGTYSYSDDDYISIKNCESCSLYSYPSGFINHGSVLTRSPRYYIRD